MQKHIKVYLEYYWIDDPDLIRCEFCGNKATDIHHIKFRSSFWKKTKHLQDDITNLIWLCRICHNKAHFKQEPYLTKEDLQFIHNQNLWNFK